MFYFMLNAFECKCKALFIPLISSLKLNNEETRELITTTNKHGIYYLIQEIQ